MSWVFVCLLIFAQAGGAESPQPVGGAAPVVNPVAGANPVGGAALPPPENQQGEPVSLLMTILPFLPIILLMYLLLLRPEQQAQKKREKLLGSLKKNDRVATIGGILGTVSNISDDGKEVTIRVDDNSKIRFRRSAIAEILGDEKGTTAAG